MCLTTPQRGEYANATNFITGEPCCSIWQSNVSHEQVNGIAVMTDGLLNLSVSHFLTTNHFADFFDPLFRYLDVSTDEQQAQRQSGSAS